MDWLRWIGYRADPVPVEPETDAIPADPGRPRQSDPEARRKIKFRRRVSVSILGAVFVGGLVAALVGEGGHQDSRRLRREIGRLHGDNERSRQEVLQLEDAVRRLQRDPIARERIARELLGLVLPGETDFLLPKPSPEPLRDEGSTPPGEPGE